VKPIVFQAIGVICMPFTEVSGMSVQASVLGGTPGRIELQPAFVDGLQDLDGISNRRTGRWGDRLSNARCGRTVG